MSDDTTDILLRIRVEVNNLSAMASLERATQQLERARLQTAKSAAQAAAAEQRLNNIVQAGVAATQRAASAELRRQKDEQALATAVTRHQAAEEKLSKAQNDTRTSAAKLAQAQLGVEKAALAAATAQARLSKSTSDASRAANLARASQSTLAKAESGARIAATGEQAALQRLAKATSDASVAADRATMSSMRLKAAKDKEMATWRASAGSLNLAGRALRGLFGNLTAVERKLDAVFRAAVHMQTMGRQLMQWGLKVGGMIVDVTKQWGDFEFMLGRASAAAGIFSNTAPMYQAMKKAIYDAAGALKLFDPTEIAQATYFWQSTTGEQIKTLPQLKQMVLNVSEAMKVAAMTQSDYETVIKGGYSIMRQYGMTLKDIPYIMHSLFLETQATALEFPNLIESFKMMGPLAHALGVSFEEVSITLGLLGDLGIRGSQAGRGLGMFFTQMVRPAPKGIKALNDLLLKVMGVRDGYKKLVFPKGKFIGMEKFITLLAKATKGLTDQQKLNYITSIVGTQNAARVIIPLINAQIEAIKKGTSIYAESKYSFANATKAFQRSWELLGNSWNGVVGGIKNTLLPILLTIGEVIAKNLAPVLNDFSALLNDMRPIFEDIAKTVAESLTPVIQWFQKMVRQVVNWIKNNPKMAKQIATWLAFGTVIMLVVGAVLLLLGTLAFLVTNLILVGAGVLPIIAVLAGVAYALITNMGGITDAFKRMWDSLKRIFQIMLGGSEDTQMTWDDLIAKGKELLTTTLEKIATALERVSDWLDSLTPEQVQTIKDIVAALVGLIVLDKVLGLAITFIGLFKNIGIVAGWLATSVFPSLLLVGKAVFGGLKILFSGLWAVARPVLIGIAWIIGFVAGALEISFLAAAALVAAIAAVVSGITAFIFNIGGFRDWVIGVFNTVVAFIGEVLGNIGKWLGEAFQNIVNAIGGAFQAFVDFVSSIPGAIGDFIGSIIEAIAGFIGGILDAIGKFLQDLYDNWGTYLGNIVGLIIGWAANITKTIQDFVTSVVKTIVDFLMALPGHFFKWLGEAATNITNWITDTIEAVGKFVGDFLKAIADFLIALPGNVADWLYDVFVALGKWFTETITFVATEAGKMVDGVVNWFIGLPDRIIAAIAGLGKMLGDVFSGLLTAGGDLMKAIGEVASGIVNGIWQGILDLKDYFARQINNFFNGIIDGVKTALGISSPSKVFAEIGKNMMLGLAKGLSQTDAAVTAMSGATSAVLDAASAGLSPFTTEIASLTGGFNYSRTTEATKQIDLNVNVTSGDGSVSALDMETLSNLITGSEMVRALEMMATVN